MERQLLLEELKSFNQNHIEFFKKLQYTEPDLLTRKADNEKWNTLEVTEHLRRYAEYYLPEIEQALDSALDSPGKDFSPGWLGNYFANAMKPGSPKMNTFKSKNPLGEKISVKVLDDFLTQLTTLAVILEKSKDKNLSKIKIKTTMPLVKINAGDALRVVIYHNERHVHQIKGLIGNMA